MAVVAFYGLAGFLGELDLSFAKNLDGVVGCAEGFEKVSLAGLVHLAFDHHDVVVGSAYH